MDMIAEHVEQGPGRFFYITESDVFIWTTRAELNEATSRQCNFQRIGSATTEICRLITRFHGLTTMPPEFQRIRDLTLAGITNTFAFIDNILFVTHGTEDEQIKNKY